MTPDPTLIEQELLPCPFCSEAPKLAKHFSGAQVHCTRDKPVQHSFIVTARSEAAAIAAWNARTLQGSAALPSDGGYVAAFYELAKMMGIGARTDAPKVVWEREMKPRILTMLRAPTPTAPGDEIDRITAEEFARAGISPTPETGLVEALKPFVTIANHCAGEPDETVLYTHQGLMGDYPLTIGNFRSLRTLSNTSPAQPEDAK